MKIPAPGGDDDGGGEAAAGDGAGGFTRGMFVCMLRVVGSYTKINTKHMGDAGSNELFFLW
jgi:hypothetical protein